MRNFFFNNSFLECLKFWSLFGVQQIGQNVTTFRNAMLFILGWDHYLQVFFWSVFWIVLFRRGSVWRRGQTDRHAPIWRDPEAGDQMFFPYGAPFSFGTYRWFWDVYGRCGHQEIGKSRTLPGNRDTRKSDRDQPPSSAVYPEPFSLSLGLSPSWLAIPLLQSFILSIVVWFLPKAHPAVIHLDVRRLSLGRPVRVVMELGRSFSGSSSPARGCLEYRLPWWRYPSRLDETLLGLFLSWIGYLRIISEVLLLSLAVGIGSLLSWFLGLQSSILVS